MRDRAIITLMGFCAVSLAVSGCAQTDDGSGSVSVESVKSALSIGPSGHALNYFQCATEGGSCIAGDNVYVAFGANGSFLYKAAQTPTSTPCTTTYFGGDPAPNVVKACYLSNYRLVITEGGTSSSGGAPREVAFGANGVFNFATLNSIFTCNTATFGDPLPGVAKACYEPLPEYGYVATEGGSFGGLSNTPVAFGAGGNMVFTIASGSMSCSTTAFGSDPAPGLVKTCYTMPAPFITDEGNTFTPTPHHVVLFGSGLNGNFISKAFFSGTASCVSSTFGGDPDYGHTKHCYQL